MAGNFDRTLRVCVLLYLFVANLAKKKRQSRFPGTAANGLQLYVQMNVLLSIQSV